MTAVPSRCVLVFAKPPVPGRVKTRLVGRLGPEAVARLQSAFLADLYERLIASGHRTLPVWALEPGEPIPDHPPGGRRQRGEELGERLHRAFAEAGADADLVAAVGSDHPDLPARRLDEAFGALARGADLAIGPARDGGYYLIAARPRRLPRGLFSGIPWSTPGVLAATLDRAREHGMSVARLVEEEDVDTPADLDRLVARLVHAPAGFCPRSRAVLGSLGMAAEGKLTCAS